MIFVTVGSQNFPFNRLLEGIDRAAESGQITDRVIAQTGYCTYKPRFFEGIAFFNREEFVKKIEEADLIITHGGTSVIRMGLELHKRIIAVPRMKCYHEHVDDHQTEIVRQFSKDGLICEVTEMETIGEAVDRVMKMDFGHLKEEKKLVVELRRMLKEMEKELNEG